MSETTNIFIVGVGGQGIVLAGDVIGLAARLAGLEAKASEIHGMSQRGGSVVSEVRFGTQVFSPLIPPPGADVVLAFELLEGLRGLERLRPGGLAIVNRQRIIPSSVTYGAADYPIDPEGEIHRQCPRAIIVDAITMAEQMGNARMVNSILMGILATQCTIPLTCWEDALRQFIKPQYLEMNLIAFRNGAEYSLTGIGS